MVSALMVVSAVMVVVVVVVVMAVEVMAAGTMEGLIVGQLFPRQEGPLGLPLRSSRKLLIPSAREALNDCVPTLLKSRKSRRSEEAQSATSPCVFSQLALCAVRCAPCTVAIRLSYA